MILDENLFEDLDEVIPLSKIFELNPKILIVDDAREIDGLWVNTEYAKDDWDELEEGFEKEQVEEPIRNKKFIVSQEEIQKVFDNIANSNSITFVNRNKNKRFSDKYSLSNEDKINIIKSLVKDNYRYSTISTNKLHEGNTLTVFYDNLNIPIEDKTIKSIKIYIKVDDSVAGEIVVISLHD